ncbi:MAG: DUF1848 domain-containing protein, partial [Alphaproteobacteria bacterium]|nr:DUF1848 domain-containing protein [Alphaproteobacteria bacterium]
MMIISASYRTDIPAFHGKWFNRQFQQGHCWVHNPYNNKPYYVSLNPQDIDVFVFWTRNPKPFLESLVKVKNLKLPFIIQWTITNYPKELEKSV